MTRDRAAMPAFYEAHRLILAPMAGITDKVFRGLCREQGAQLTFTEMVSAKGLSYANEKTAHLIDLGDGETQVGVQLFGHEPAVMAREAAWIAEELGDKLACLDVNMGCPARKIVTKGDGAALMKDPALATAIVEAVVGAVDVPVSVKMRRGFFQDEETAPTFAQAVELAGAYAVTVHGRFAQQLYRGSSDRGVIARVKQAVSVPVVGNGDVRCGADAVDLESETGCDAVMIARAARGNPWVFAQCAAALRGEPEPPLPSFEDRLDLAKRHARLLAEAYGPVIVRMRKDAMWYVAGMPGSAAARRRITECVTCDDFCALFDEMERRLSAANPGAHVADRSANEGAMR